MAKNKNKEGAEAVGETPDEPIAADSVQPNIDPPGRAGPAKGHGLPEPEKAAPYGGDHLRAVMNMSGDVGIEKVCEEAARRLEGVYADARNRRKRGA